MTIDFEAPHGASFVYVQLSTRVSLVSCIHPLPACRGTLTGLAGMGASVNDSSPSDHTFEYEVIGEHLIDPMRLLTIDADGRLFDLNLEDGSASPAELTGDWIVDTVDANLYRRKVARVLAHSHTLVVG